MEVLVEKAREYILALMDAGNFSIDDASKVSLVPVQTVRNFCTKKTEKNPGYATIMKLVVALGGDPCELVGYEKKREIEANGTAMLKESHETRIADIIQSCETRIEDIKQLCETRIADIQNCYEVRVTDLKNTYEEIIKYYRELIQNQNTIERSKSYELR